MQAGRFCLNASCLKDHTRKNYNSVRFARMNDANEREAALDEAVARHMQGRFAEAEIVYRQILDADPEDLDALNFLGVVLLDLGKVAESEAILRDALAILPEFPEALTNLSRARLVAGSAQEAADLARQAILFDATLPEAYRQLAQALMSLRQYQEAEDAIGTAMQLAPDDGAARIVHASALLGMGKHAEGLEIAIQTLADHQNNPVIAAQAAVAFLQSGFPDDARDFYKTAMAQRPDDVTNLTGLAFCYHALRLPEKTIEAATQALEQAGSSLDLQLLLAEAHARIGHFPEAAQHAREALQINPRSGKAFQFLILDGETVRPDLLSTISNDESVIIEDRIAAAFTLGQVLDKSGDYDKAFDAYTQANVLKSQQVSASHPAYDPFSTQRLVDWLITTFPVGYKPTLSGDADWDEPVFIVGMPRSGTSLVEQILASHPDVHGLGEQKDVGAAINELNGGPVQKSPDRWTSEDVSRAAKTLKATMTAKAGGARRIVDKMPDNLFLIGYIRILYPRARIIICTRDYRDVCLSSYFQNFGENPAWSNSLIYATEQAQQVARLIKHWSQVFSDHLLVVKYDDVVADIEAESRRLIDFLGLDWYPECLAFHETNRSNETASFWQVRQPLYTTSIGRWRNYRKNATALIFGLLGIVPDPDKEDWERLQASPDDACAFAFNHYHAGRYTEAARICDAVIDGHPEHAPTLHLRGNIALLQSDIAKAIVCLECATERQPGNQGIWIDLSRAYLRSNIREKALDAARKAVDLEPENTVALCQLGYTRVECQDYEGAVAATSAAYDLAATDRDVLIAHGTILFRSGKLSEAESIWRVAEEHFPEDLEILIGLTHALIELNRHHESLRYVERMLVDHPGSTQVLLLYGWALLRHQKVPEAIATLEKALALDPALIQGLSLIAYCHEMNGDKDKAVESYRKILALEPDDGDAWGNLAKFGYIRPEDNFVSVADRLLASPTTSIEARINLSFGLGSQLERVRDYEGAFRAYRQANQFVAQNRPAAEARANIAQLQGIVDGCIATFNRALIASAAPIGIPSATPVFVVGMPRSGTTLVEQIMASHPDVVGLGEIGDFMDMLGPKARNMLLQDPNRWDPDVLRTAAEDFLKRLEADGDHAKRIVNKLPNNVLWLGFIKILFPNASVVICRRDLRDICWSCYTQHFLDQGMAWTDNLESCATYARQVEQVTDHWNMVLPGQFLEVFYEDVIEDLEREARRIIDYLGLEWTPACLAFYETKRVVMTASHAQVRRPVYSSSVGRWRPYKDHLQPLLAGLSGLIPDRD